jgi:hypothetical protein
MSLSSPSRPPVWYQVSDFDHQGLNWFRYNDQQQGTS